MRETKTNPMRVLKTGETYLQASTRVRDYGVLVWQECRRRVKQVMRERRLNQTGAEDVVLGEEYTPERMPVLPKVVGYIVPDIPWEEGRADVEAAKNDFDWVLAALHVQLPAGVGKPYLRRYLEHLRASKTLSDRFLASVTIRLSGGVGEAPAETGPGPEDETIEQIVRRARNGQATVTLP